MKFFTSFWRRQFDEMSTVQQKTAALLEKALHELQQTLQLARRGQELIDKLLDEREKRMKEIELTHCRRETLIAESKK